MLISKSYSTVYIVQQYVWWCHQMETFSALLALCEGNHGRWISLRKASDAELWCVLLSTPRLSKRFSKQSRSRWFETPLLLLWHHNNASSPNHCMDQWRHIAKLTKCIFTKVYSTPTFICENVFKKKYILKTSKDFVRGLHGLSWCCWHIYIYKYIYIYLDISKPYIVMIRIQFYCTITKITS